MVTVVNVTIDLSVTMVIWFPRLVLFLNFAIIIIRVTKQHILEAYFLFLPHGQILTKILVSISYSRMAQIPGPTCTEELILYSST